jgi:hypothetical protein
LPFARALASPAQPLNDRTLELGEHADHLEQRVAACGRRVDSLDV